MKAANSTENAIYLWTQQWPTQATPLLRMVEHEYLECLGGSAGTTMLRLRFVGFCWSSCFLGSSSLRPSKRLLKFRSRLAAGVKGNLSIHAKIIYFNAFSSNLFYYIQTHRYFAPPLLRPLYRALADKRHWFPQHKLSMAPPWPSFGSNGCACCLPLWLLPAPRPLHTSP